MERDVKFEANKFVDLVESNYKGKDNFKETGVYSSDVYSYLETISDYLRRSPQLNSGEDKDNAKSASGDVAIFLGSLFRLLATYTLPRMRYGNPSAAKGSDDVKFAEAAALTLDYIFGVKSVRSDGMIKPTSSGRNTTITAYIQIFTYMAKVYSTKKDAMEGNPSSQEWDTFDKYVAQAAPGFKRALKNLWIANKELAAELAFAPSLSFEQYRNARTSFRDAVLDLACVLDSRIEGFNETIQAKAEKKSKSKKSKSKKSKSKKRKIAATCTSAKVASRRSASVKRRKQRQAKRGGARIK